MNSEVLYCSCGYVLLVVSRRCSDVLAFVPCDKNGHPTEECPHCGLSLAGNLTKLLAERRQFSNGECLI